MGIGKHRNLVNVIDFGLAKNFCDPMTHLHIPLRENKTLIGTAQYMSMNTHLGVEQARQDNLESLGYVLLYFLCGRLPWQDMWGKPNTQKYNFKIMEEKMSTPTDVLCHGFPYEFGKFLNYTHALHFDDKPDYSYLRKLFQFDYIFDWSPQCNAEDDPSSLSGLWVKDYCS